MTRGKVDDITREPFSIEGIKNNSQDKELLFNELFEKHKKQLYFYIRKMVLLHEDADDVLQNTFLKIWKGLESFRGESKISTWMHRIAYNESITFLNKKNQKRSSSLQSIDNWEEKLTSDVYYCGNEMQLKLQLALTTLPAKQKSVFVFKYFEHMKYEEISEITGTSVGALKASYHHAVKKIEEFIKEK